MDDALDKLYHEFDLVGLVSRVLVNWYPDGEASAGGHRHDCWTALLSFGHERILSVDNVPLLMQNGDLVEDNILTEKFRQNSENSFF